MTSNVLELVGLVAFFAGLWLFGGIATVLVGFGAVLVAIGYLMGGDT